MISWRTCITRMNVDYANCAFFYLNFLSISRVCRKENYNGERSSVAWYVKLSRAIVGTVTEDAARLSVGQRGEQSKLYPNEQPIANPWIIFVGQWDADIRKSRVSTNGYL